MAKKGKKKKSKGKKKKNEITFSYDGLKKYIIAGLCLVAIFFIVKFAIDKYSEQTFESQNIENSYLITECLSRSNVDTGIEINGLLQITLRDECDDNYGFKVKQIRMKYQTIYGDNKYITFTGPWIVNNEAKSLTINTGKRGVNILDAYHLKEGIEIIEL